MMFKRTTGTKNTLKRLAAGMLAMALVLGVLPASAAFASGDVRSQVSGFIAAADRNLVLSQVSELLESVAAIDHNELRSQVAGLAATVDTASIGAIVGVWNSYFSGIAPLPENVGTHSEIAAFIAAVDRDLVLRQMTELIEVVMATDFNVIRSELIGLAATVPAVYLEGFVGVWNRLF